MIVDVELPLALDACPFPCEARLSLGVSCVGDHVEYLIRGWFVLVRQEVNERFWKDFDDHVFWGERTYVPARSGGGIS